MKEVVLIVLLNDNGEVLAVSRKTDHNDFGLVGGKVDEGESIEDAAFRETLEETGLNISNLNCIYQQFRNSRMGDTLYAGWGGRE